MKLVAWKFVVGVSVMAFAVTGCATAPREYSAAPVQAVAQPPSFTSMQAPEERMPAAVEQSIGRAFKIGLGAHDTAPAGLLQLCQRLAEFCDEPKGSSPRWSPPAEASGFVLTSMQSSFENFAPTSANPKKQSRSIQAVELTVDRRAHLNRINRQINGAIRQVTDAQAYGQSEYWTLPLSSRQDSRPNNQLPMGDCEDFALEKRAALINSGWPEDSLYLAVGFSQRTGLHAVLVVATDQGDLVLDNTVSWIDPVQRTDYTWIRRQASTDLRNWVMAGSFQRLDQLNNFANREASSTDLAAATSLQASATAPVASVHVASVRVAKPLVLTRTNSPMAASKGGAYPQLDDLAPAQSARVEKRGTEKWQEANPATLDSLGLN